LSWAPEKALAFSTPRGSGWGGGAYNFSLHESHSVNRLAKHPFETKEAPCMFTLVAIIFLFRSRAKSHVPAAVGLWYNPVRS